MRRKLSILAAAAVVLVAVAVPMLVLEELRPDEDREHGALPREGEASERRSAEPRIEGEQFGGIGCGHDAS